MSHKIIISYSEADRILADKVCKAIEDTGIKCWIAPRDIVPGEVWLSAIVNAISQSTILVLIFTKQSNGSKYVVREVTHALSEDKLILPFRAEDVLPSDSLNLLLNTQHWLDASSRPIEPHIEGLVQTIEQILSGSRPERTYTPQPTDTAAQKKPARWLLLSACVLVLCLLGGWVISQVSNGGGAEPITGGDLEQVDPSLAADSQLKELWRLADYRLSYHTALEHEQNEAIDPTIPAYWRVMSKQSETYQEWKNQKDPSAIHALELEYEACINNASQGGSRIDDLLYQQAHFFRFIGRQDASFTLLKELAEKYPDSNYREGIAFFLGSAYAEQDQVELAQAQLARLQQFDINARMWHFDKEQFVSVSEASHELELFIADVESVLN